MTILIRSIKNVPIRAFLAFPNNVEIANERDIAVFIQTIRRINIGPGLIAMISRRKAAANRRNIDMESIADRRKSA